MENLLWRPLMGKSRKKKKTFLLCGATCYISCPRTAPLTPVYWLQGSYKKLNLKFKNVQEHFGGGGKQIFFKNISGASSAHFIYNTINRNKVAHRSWCCKKCEQWLLSLNRHSFLLRAEVI